MAPQALVILDGLGYRAQTLDNALAHARTPALDQLLTHYPWTTLQAAGTAVGLMNGQPGNSAVGHFTLGSGAIVQQPLTHLTQLVRSGELMSLAVIKNNFTHLAQTGKQLHLLCVASDGNVHSSLEQVLAIIQIAAHYRIATILVHAILDGRDVAQKSAPVYLQRIQNTLDELPSHIHGIIATVQGHLYAMDRSENLERAQLSYDLLTHRVGHEAQSWQEVLAQDYQNNVPDEIIPPTTLIPDPSIHTGDGLLFLTVRGDRGRELTRLLLQEKKLSFLITGVPYDTAHADRALVPAPRAEQPLMHELELRHKTTFTIAESEKAAHVSYFFNGGDAAVHTREERVIIQSDDPVTFINNPRMKADAITRAVQTSLTQDPKDFYLINYANADMIGHTGNLRVTVQAIECLDEQLTHLHQLFVVERRGTLYVTADHGNAEDKRHGSPAHTTNPVYFIAARNPTFSDQEIELLTQLRDVKSFILKNIS